MEAWFWSPCYELLQCCAPEQCKLIWQQRCPEMQFQWQQWGKTQGPLSSWANCCRSAAMQALPGCSSLALGNCRIKCICWSHLPAGNALNLSTSVLLVAPWPGAPWAVFYRPVLGSLQWGKSALIHGTHTVFKVFSLLDRNCIFNRLWLWETWIWFQYYEMYLISLACSHRHTHFTGIQSKEIQTKLFPVLSGKHKTNPTQ